MSRDRRITYMVDGEGLVYSRVRNEVAIPVLDFEGMKSENGYEMNYNLERFNIFNVLNDIRYATHTREIPLDIKNAHRKYYKQR